MLDDLPEPDGFQVRIVEQRLERVDAHRGDVPPVQLGQPFGVRPARRDPRELLVELLDVLEARCERLVARVLQQILSAGEDEEVSPVLVGVRQDREIAVARLERAPVGIEDPLVADRVPRRHERLAVEVLHHHPGRHALEHRHLDLLPLARARLVVERREHGRQHGHRAGLVGDDRGHVARLAHERRLSRGEAGGRLDDIVVRGFFPVGAGRPEAVRADVDDTRVDGAERFVRHAEAPRGLRPIVVEQHVGALGEPEQHAPGGLLLQIEHDRTFVSIDRQVERAHGGVAHRAELPRGIAFGRLDLDDVGAEVTELLRGPGAEHDGRAIHHSDAGQRSRHGREPVRWAYAPPVTTSVWPLTKSLSGLQKR
jgi:hypothetical protein